MNNIYILSDKKVDGAKNLPVFNVDNIKPDIDISGYDALIFTSKNALYAIESQDIPWKGIPSYAIAPQTANIIKKMGGNLVFTGETNHGNEFAKELIEVLKNKKTLYIRGEKIVSNLVSILKNSGIVCDEVIVYKTSCKELDPSQQPPNGSIIIFSAPSTIKCFLKNFKWDESYKAVAIGKTTAKYFPPEIKPVISPSTSLASCVQTARNI